MPALYNEIDPAAIAVLQHLIAEDVIAPGVVDGRSIKDLKGADLEGFEQVHLFAGGGLWSVAARLARWPDNRPLWTCSCPCQPWSTAGEQRGEDDPRHLWPDVLRLIREAGDDRPAIIVGEQVSGKAGYGWLDRVFADLESEGYTCWAVDIAACSVDSPNQRNRIYWWALDNTIRLGRRQGRNDHQPHDRQIAGATDQYYGRPEELADPDFERRQERQPGTTILRGQTLPAGDDVPRQQEPMANAQGSKRGPGLRETVPKHDGPISSDTNGCNIILGDGIGPGLEGVQDTERQPASPSRRPAIERTTRRDSGCGGVENAERGRRRALGTAGHHADRNQTGREQSPGGSREPDHGERQTVADGTGSGLVPAPLTAVRGGEESAGPRHGQPERPHGVHGDMADTDGVVIQGQSPAGNQPDNREVQNPGNRNGTYWSDAEWIICHDGKARRTKPGLCLLVDGFPGRVDLWRIGGNAIVPILAAEVITAIAETIEEEIGRAA